MKKSVISLQHIPVEIKHLGASVAEEGLVVVLGHTVRITDMVLAGDPADVIVGEIHVIAGPSVIVALLHVLEQILAAVMTTVRVVITAMMLQLRVGEHTTARHLVVKAPTVVKAEFIVMEHFAMTNTGVRKTFAAEKRKRNQIRFPLFIISRNHAFRFF